MPIQVPSSPLQLLIKTVFNKQQYNMNAPKIIAEIGCNHEDDMNRVYKSRFPF